MNKPLESPDTLCTVVLASIVTVERKNMKKYIKQIKLYNRAFQKFIHSIKNKQKRIVC